ncbi:MAG: NAD-dependent epimerase/dehydratase family protein [Flavobacteriaceae bacterium]
MSATSSFEDYLIISSERNACWICLKPLPKTFFCEHATSSIYGLNARGSKMKRPNPPSWYGVTKLAAEQLVLAYSRRELLKGTFRLYSVYGPLERPDKLYTYFIDCS